MKNLFFLTAMMIPLTVFSQNGKNFKGMELKLPKIKNEPKRVSFGNNSIDLDGNKCFSYELFHDVEKDGVKLKNYYEVKDLQGNLIFKGNISNENAQKIWTDHITFVTLDNKIYLNKNVVGRKNLILNLASNQVLGADCAVNANNLRLFYDRSNENK